MKAKTPDAGLNEYPITYEYSADELTTVARRGPATTITKRDLNRGWLDSVEAPHGSIAYQHNDFGQTIAATVTSGVGSKASTHTTSYGYDELSRLEKITAWDNKQWVYGYDEVGNKETLTRPNGTVTTYHYDVLNRLDALQTVKGTGVGAQVLSRFDYHLRPDGRRDGLTELLRQPDGTTTNRSLTYAFDDANRLIGESGSDGAGKAYTKSYTLDEAGNRKQLVEQNQTATGTQNITTAYQYSEQDWLLSQTSWDGTSTTSKTYGYDLNGNQKSITTQVGSADPSTIAQVWGFEGHLLARGAVNAQGNWTGNRTEYSYDAGGMRLSQSTKSEDGQLQVALSYLWEGDRVVEERDKDGELQTRYDHGQELGPLRQDAKSETGVGGYLSSFFIVDGQDSTRQLTDVNGNVTNSYFYDAFGVTLPGAQNTPTNTASTAFKYTGQQQDASGLYYLRARYYDAGTGRFLSHDPVLGNSDDPLTFHRYLYTSVDPINYSDPSGKSQIGQLLQATWIQVRLIAMNASPANAAIERTLHVIFFLQMAQAISNPTSQFAQHFRQSLAEQGPIMAEAQLLANTASRTRSIVAQEAAELRAIAAGAMARAETFGGAVAASEATEVGIAAMRTATAVRNSPGVASGNGIAAGERWLSETGGRFAFIPRQVADKLRGQSFNTFADFRKKFWETVAESPELLRQFSPQNQQLIRNGEAPFAPPSLQLGGEQRYSIHHAQEIQDTMSVATVYDMDNLVVAAPRIHKGDFHGQNLQH